MRLDVIFAVLLLIAFFLPWIGGDSGFAIAQDLLSSEMPVEDALVAAGIPRWFIYVFYAIPVAAVLTLIVGLARGPSNVFAIIAGAAPWVLVLYPVVEGVAEFGQIIDGLEIGGYATLLAGLLLFLNGLGILRTRS